MINKNQWKHIQVGDVITHASGWITFVVESIEYTNEFSNKPPYCTKVPFELTNEHKETLRFTDPFIKNCNLTRPKPIPLATEVHIVVKGGLVSSVYSNLPTIKINVHDLDLEGKERYVEKVALARYDTMYDRVNKSGSDNELKEVY
jgi:hypothetical protein